LVAEVVFSHQLELTARLGNLDHQDGVPGGGHDGAVLAIEVEVRALAVHRGEG